MHRRSSPRRRPSLPLARGLVARALALYAAPLPLFLVLALTPDYGVRVALALTCAVVYIGLGAYLDYCARLHTIDLLRAIRDDAAQQRTAVVTGRSAVIEREAIRQPATD